MAQSLDFSHFHQKLLPLYKGPLYVQNWLVNICTNLIQFCSGDFSKDALIIKHSHNQEENYKVPPLFNGPSVSIIPPIHD